MLVCVIIRHFYHGLFLGFFVRRLFFIFACYFLWIFFIVTVLFPTLFFEKIGSKYSNGWLAEFLNFLL